MPSLDGKRLRSALAAAASPDANGDGCGLAPPRRAPRIAQRSAGGTGAQGILGTTVELTSETDVAR